MGIDTRSSMCLFSQPWVFSPTASVAQPLQFLAMPYIDKQLPAGADSPSVFVVSSESSLAQVQPMFWPVTYQWPNMALHASDLPPAKASTFFLRVGDMEPHIYL